MIEIKVTEFDEKAFNNLLKILSAKKTLISKSLSVDNLDVVRTSDAVQFPWNADEQEHMDITRLFAEKLCEYSKKVMRTTDKEKISSNEKYDFRAFLIRIGMGGSEYKKERQLLLKNLPGDAAYKKKIRQRKKPKSTD